LPNKLDGSIVYESAPRPVDHKNKIGDMGAASRPGF
jgi:hypothetical protein